MVSVMGDAVEVEQIVEGHPQPSPPPQLASVIEQPREVFRSETVFSGVTYLQQQGNTYSSRVSLLAPVPEEHQIRPQSSEELSMRNTD
jgi:hypothetical protein